MALIISFLTNQVNKFVIPNLKNIDNVTIIMRVITILK